MTKAPVPTPSLELISFRLCPFVQRAVILLAHKQIEHKVTYVDLGDPPGWFREVSPLGKVPVLRVDGEVPIFGSAVISEYLDEVTPPPLMPDDPMTRARNRSWINNATSVLMPQRDLTTVKSATEFQAVVSDLQLKLDPLEAALGNGPFFNGSAASLVDTTYAPVFVRHDYFKPYLGNLTPSDRFPGIAAWHTTLTGLAAVRVTIGDDFTARMDELVAKRQGHMASLLPAGTRTTGPAREY